MSNEIEEVLKWYKDSEEKLNSTMTKSDLSEKYKTLYKHPPKSRLSREELFNQIRLYAEGISRAQNFKRGW